MSKNIKYLDIENVCRICLEEDNDLILLFDQNFAHDDLLLSELISECTKCSVKICDEYPQHICRNCLNNLKISYDFRKMCKESHKVIRLFLNGNKDSLIPIIENNIPMNEKYTQTELQGLILCEKCDERFYSSEELSRHRYRYHKNTKNECRICKKTFNRIDSLKNHLAFRHSEFGYINKNDCKICNKKFSRPSNLRSHLLRHKERADEIQIHTDEQDESDISQDDDVIKIEKEPERENCNVDCKTIENENFYNNSNDLLVSFKTETYDCISIQNYEILDDNEDNNDTNLQYNQDSTEITQQHDKNDDLNDISFQDDDESNSIVENTTVEMESALVGIETNLENKANHSKPKIECSTCNKTFTRRTHLRRHERNHIFPKPHTCYSCDKSFSRLEHLNHHKEIYHSDMQPHKCEKCGKGFTRIINLKKHLNQDNCSENDLVKGKKPKLFKCNICSKSFTTERYFKYHVITHDKKKYPCKFCDVVFTTKDESVEHAKTHANQRPYLCSECGLRFVRNDYLTVHMRRHTGEKPFVCKFCGKGFPRSTDLNVHVRYHTGEKTHLCVTCGKGFQRAYNLVVHMRVHTGEKPYKCPHCVRSFTQGNDLKAHVRRHTGERFQCDICNEGFIQGYHLTHHKKTVHNIDQPSHIRRVEKVKMLKTKSNKQDDNTEQNPIETNSESTHKAKKVK